MHWDTRNNNDPSTQPLISDRRAIINKLHLFIYIFFIVIIWRNLGMRSRACLPACCLAAAWLTGCRTAKQRGEQLSRTQLNNYNLVYQPETSDARSPTIDKLHFPMSVHPAGRSAGWNSRVENLPPAVYTTLSCVESFHFSVSSFWSFYFF